MKVKLDLERKYTTRDMNHRDVIVRTIKAEREIDIPTEFLPSHIRIGENDFYQDRNLWDVGHNQWIFFVQPGHLGRDHLHEADGYVASLENTGWKIIKDEKSIEMCSFTLGRSDAIALIEVAEEGLNARGVKLHRLRWNKEKAWTDFELQDSIQRICRAFSKNAM